MSIVYMKILWIAIEWLQVAAVLAATAAVAAVVDVLYVYHFLSTHQIYLHTECCLFFSFSPWFVYVVVAIVADSGLWRWRPLLAEVEFGCLCCHYNEQWMSFQFGRSSTVAYDDEGCVTEPRFSRLLKNTGRKSNRLYAIVWAQLMMRSAWEFVFKCISSARIAIWCNCFVAIAFIHA